MKPHAFGLAFLVVAACGKATETATEDIPPPVPSDEVECGDNAPTVEAVAIADNGFFQCEQEDWPSITLTATTTDPDADLTFYQYRLWWDTTVDGFVDTDGSYLEVQKTLSDEDCSVPEVDLTMILCITGNPPYETEVEFGVVVLDEKGNESNGGEAAIGVFTTPDANGNY